MASKIRKIFNLIVAILISLSTVSQAAGFSTSGTKLMDIVRDMAAQWFFIFKYFSIALMLVVLIYLGIKLVISSIAEERAKYKRMLVDWLVGFIIIFTIQYYMVFILKLNEIFVELARKVSANLAQMFVTGEEYALGLEVTTTGLYEMIRTRAYELRFSIGTSGMIMYMVLIYYTIKFVFIYFKRFFTVFMLTILAPLMGLFYAFNKVMTGKAATFKKWAAEYAFNVFLQTIHAITYGVFVTLAIGLSSSSIAGFILAMVMLNFMGQAEKIMRKIFKLSGGIVDDNANKGIRENLAAATAMKASMGAVFGTQMAKDIGNGAKNLIGGAFTLGARTGMVAYDKGVDKLLENQKKQKEEEEKKLKEEEERSRKETINDKDRIRRENAIKARIAKLDESIKGLEEAKEKKNKRLEGYRGGIQDPEKLQEYLDEKTKGIHDPELRRKEQERLREENKNKILKRVVSKDKYTGQVSVSGVGTKIKREIDKVIWGNDAAKSIAKDIVKTTATGLSGAVMTLASIPMIVTEPVAGLALLAKGRANSKKLFSNSDYRKAANLGERNAIRAGQRVIRQRHKEEINKLNKESKTIKKQRKVLRKSALAKDKGRKLSFNRFSPRSLETIKAQMKMDSKLNSIRKMNSLSLGNLVLTAPLRLTGTIGAVRTIQGKAYKMHEARKDYYENLETFSTLEKKDSISKDFITDYNLRIAGITSAIDEKSDSEVMTRFGEDTGKVVTIGDTKFQFGKDIKAPASTVELKSQIIDNVLLRVAAKNKVLDIKDLNLKSTRIQTELVEEFRKVGVLKDTTIPEEFELDKTLKLNLDKLKDRVEVIAKDNPRAVEETIAKEVIVSYMARNNIEDAAEIKKEEHKEKIKTEILEILEEKDDTRPFEIVESERESTRDISNIITESVESFERDETVESEEIREEVEYTTKETAERVVSKPVVERDKDRLENTETIDQIDPIETIEHTPIQTSERTAVRQELGINNDKSESLEIPSITTDEIPENLSKIIEGIRSGKKSETTFADTKKDSPEPSKDSGFQDLLSRMGRLEAQVKTQEKKVVKEERLELFESLISSLEKVDTTVVDDMIENEVIAEERKRQVEIGKGELDSQLEGFERIINEDIDDSQAIEDYIGQVSPDVDELLGQLLAIKEQDMVGLALKFKPNSYEQKRMNSIDLERVNSTYRKKI